jgi:hypothetical protein
MEVKYTNQWKAQFAKRLFIGRFVQRLFGGNMSTYLFLKMMQHNKWLANTLIKATHGKPF